MRTGAAEKVSSELRKLADPSKAKVLSSFFKTGKGEYGEGDIFLGVTVPVQRKIARRYLHDISLREIPGLLRSETHEFRMTALIMLTYLFEKADEAEREEIFRLYMGNTRYINNWDLVDITAPKIPGTFLLERPRDPLYGFAVSKKLWERRIAIVATYAFIKRGSYEDCLRISEMLLNDREDLIHKAVGWMLREVGKKDKSAETGFLDRHCSSMPRTMLRYAIEKFPEKERKGYLRK